MKQLRLWNPTPFERGEDSRGSGAFGAPRGSRRHTGRDYEANPGADIMCPCEGVVTRIGQCYADDPTFKLVEIQHDRATVRVLYVDPFVAPGRMVLPGQTIGYAQDITERYEGITNHVHLDCRLTTGILADKGATPAGVLWVDPALFMF